MPVGYRDDQNTVRFDAVDDAERVPSQQVPPRSMVEAGPRFGSLRDRSFGVIDRVDEPQSRRIAARGIPTSRSLGLFEGLLEVLKLLSHVLMRRVCGDGLQTRKSSWRI